MLLLGSLGVMGCGLLCFAGLIFSPVSRRVPNAPVAPTTTPIPTVAPPSALTPALIQTPFATREPAAQPTSVPTRVVPLEATGRNIQPIAPVQLTTPRPTIAAQPTATGAFNQFGSDCDCSANLYNCDDFVDGDEAQACFEHCVSEGAGDIHQLDRDDDKWACEYSGW